MSLKRRVVKLEAKSPPQDEWIDFCGMRIKESWVKPAMEAAEGSVLRPTCERQ